MKIKSAIVTSVLTASLVTSVFASEASADKPLPQFTAADTQMLFDQSIQPVQLAALSQLEMKETEGAGSLTIITRSGESFTFRTTGRGSFTIYEQFMIYGNPISISVIGRSGGFPIIANPPADIREKIKPLGPILYCPPILPRAPRQV